MGKLEARALGRLSKGLSEGPETIHTKKSGWPEVTTRGTGPGVIRVARKIRYTDGEWDTILERARACGQPPARYVRDVSLGAVPKIGRVQATAPLVHELGRIGNALTALAAQERAGGGQERAAAIGEALSELLAVVRRLT